MKWKFPKTKAIAVEVDVMKRVFGLRVIYPSTVRYQPFY